CGTLLRRNFGLPGSTFHYTFAIFSDTFQSFFGQLGHSQRKAPASRRGRASYPAFFLVAGFFFGGFVFRLRISAIMSRSHFFPALWRAKFGTFSEMMYSGSWGRRTAST